MSEVPARQLEDDEVISQCGQRRADGSWNFRNSPRPGKDPEEHDVSFLMGRLTPQAARLEAFGKEDFKQGKHAVRHALVGQLRSAGFTVEHTPRLGTAKHVSVYWLAGEWSDKEASLLDSQCMGGEI